MKTNLSIILLTIALSTGITLAETVKERAERLTPEKIKQFEEQSLEARRKAYEIALKEFIENKVEIVELEHDHMQCIMLWQKHNSINSLHRTLDKLMLEKEKNLKLEASPELRIHSQ